ncbi:MAG: isoamylase [Alteromonadaceae bacterium]
MDDFHQADIEVILDVVYNHTAESDHLGPTLSFKGIDNASYYRLQAEQHRYYVNDTGCGNTFNVSHPQVMRLVMDSLRYWATEMGVDGFRFDLASVMGREINGFNPRSAFLQAIAQDPQLAKVKLIAEPWDIGPGGYQLGSFPASWSEWNDEYRDTIRRFWRNEPGQLATFARRLHGSSDIFEHNGRRPDAGINFITSHDGFTLRDLVSYQHRHNQANGENNADGHRENLSENFGVEGPTDDPQVNLARQQQQRNLLATLMLSQGVPMLTAGDESGRTQQGNNNAYCQDNAINWIDWSNSDPAANSTDMQAFVSLLLKVRREHPVLHHQNYIHTQQTPNDATLVWLNSDGQPMRDEHWQEHHNQQLGYLLSGPIEDAKRSYVLVIFNASDKQHRFYLPNDNTGRGWQWLVDTTQSTGTPLSEQLGSEATISLPARSVNVLCSSKKNRNIQP